MILLLLACSTTETLDVFAASSLGPAFEALEASFEASHPGIDVRVSTAGSQTLRLQLEQGAHADVFASADVAHIEATPFAGGSIVFARNTVVLATPNDEPLTSLEALAHVDRWVSASPAVPVGAHTVQILAEASNTYGPAWANTVASKKISEERSVRQVRARLIAGEADAGFVYRSDVGTELSEVPGVAVPTELSVAVLHSSTRGAEWVDWLGGEDARATLRAHGFQ